MKQINISVENRIACTDDPKNHVYVCGNNDYTVKFSFDDEWSLLNTKTARFSYEDGTYTDVVFVGSTVAVPVVQNAYSFTVGVYAGQIRTSTVATVYCKKSVLSDGGTPVTPTADVYTQIIGMLSRAVTEDNLDEAIDQALEQAHESGEFDGEDGADGADGFSPSANVSKTGRTATITITDKDGTTTATVTDGQDGQPGQNGQNGRDGVDGQNGQDGFSPVASVVRQTGKAVISVTDASGTTSAEVFDGSDATVTEDAIVGALGYTPADNDDIGTIKNNISELGQLLPEATPTVGKMLKVLSVNDDGTFVCGWADGGGSSVDVQINGTSIVQDGVANIPIASSTEKGVAGVSSNYGISTYNGLLTIVGLNDAQIASRSGGNRPVIANNINTAVKAALTDANRITGLTSAEMDNACGVIGAVREGSWELLYDVTTTEDLDSFSVNSSVLGTGVKLKAIHMSATFEPYTSGGAVEFHMRRNGADEDAMLGCGNTIGTVKRYAEFTAVLTYGKWISLENITLNSNAWYTQTYSYTNKGKGKMDALPIDQLLVSRANNAKIPTGSVIKVWGVRA